LYFAQPVGAEAEQLLGEPGARRDPCGGLDHRLHLLAPVLVGNAEDRDVADLGMREQRSFDLGRVDVDATRDDHVDLAVAEEEIAVLVQVADVADREEPVAPVVGGLLRILVVLEVQSTARGPCRRCRARSSGAASRRRRGCGSPSRPTRVRPCRGSGATPRG